jgi:hypothetical protein
MTVRGNSAIDLDTMTKSASYPLQRLQSHRNLPTLERRSDAWLGDFNGAATRFNGHLGWRGSSACIVSPKRYPFKLDGVESNL